MKISEAQKKYNLPTIAEKDMIRICRALNIPATNLDFNLTDEQIERLLYSKDIHVLDVSAKTDKMHNDFLANYTNLRNKYNELSKRMGSKGYLAQDKKVIDALQKGLEQAQKKYEDAIKDVENNTLSPLRRGVIGFYGDKIEKKDAVLVDKYKELDELVKNGKLYKTKFKQKRNYAKIQRVQKSIDKLRAKQGKLETKQKKVVNKGTEKYIKGKAKEHDAYLENLQRESIYAEKIINNRIQRADHKRDLAVTEKELKDLESKTGIKAGLERMHLKSDKRKLESKIKALKRKEGRCAMANQYSRTVSINYQTNR